MKHTRALRTLFFNAGVAALATASLAAKPHNGTSEFAALFGNSLGDDQVTFGSPLAYGAMGNLPALTSVREVDSLARQLSIQKTPAKSGAAKPQWETFGFAQWNGGDFDKGNDEWPIYDAQTFGGLIGIQNWIDDERLVGATISYNSMRADIHDGFGRIDGDSARLRLYAALMPEDQPWRAFLGASGGYNSYDSKRIGALGRKGPDNTVIAETLTGDNDGFDVGVFAGVTAQLKLAENLELTPFFRIDYNIVHSGHFDEKTTLPTTSDTDRTFAQKISRFDAESLQTRLGTGIEYTATVAGAPMCFAFSAAWVSELAGNDIDIRSELAAFPGAKSTTYANQLFGDAFEFVPSVTYVLGNGMNFQLAYTAVVTVDGQLMQSASFGVGYRF